MKYILDGFIATDEDFSIRIENFKPEFQKYITFDYPESIDAVSAYTTNGSTITIVDSDGELWIKGSDTGLGNSSNTFICVTKKEYLSEPIWNTIRNRWSLIYRKY